MMVHGHAIKYSTRKKKSQNLTLMALEKKLNDIEELQSESIFSFHKNEQQVMLVKKDIEEIRAKKTQGAIIRAKTDWFLYGEKPSKYFLP